MSYEDKETHQIFEIRFKATNAEADWVWMQVQETGEWLEYDAKTDAVEFGTWHAHEGSANALLELCTRCAQLKKFLTKLVYDLVKKQGLLNE